MPREISPERMQRLRRYWDQHARSDDRQMAFWERRLFGDGRRWICSQASGDVLEVAIGTGRNLPYYPQGIRLTGIEFSPAMLELARRQADRLGLKVDLRQGDAQALELPDASFDTVVCTLSLCAIPDAGLAVAEMRRVLRPAAGYCCWTTWPAPRGGYGRSSGCWSGSPSPWARSTCGAAHSRSRPKASRSSGGNAPSSAWSSG